MVPAIHRADSIREFRVILLIDTAGVYPEESKTVSCSPISAEVYLLPARLALADARFYVLEADLVAVILGPRMRENRIWRNIIVAVLGEDEFVIRFKLQEAHRETLIVRRWVEG